MRIFVLVAAVFLQGCATGLGQNIVNPNVSEAEWKAEQQYFVNQLEKFCFDRPWDKRPLSLSQNRPLHGSKNYNLWGRITDDMRGSYTSDFHYVCHLTANIPMYHAAFDVNGYRIRRSSPWAYGNRRQAFHQLLQSRYGALDAKLAASTDSHQIPSGIGMLLRDGETQITVQYFNKNSGVRLSVHRRQIFEDAESNLANYPAGSKVAPWHDIYSALGNNNQGNRPSFIKVEAPVSPIKLIDILSFDQLSEEQLNELQSSRENLPSSTKARLQAQTQFNLYRFDQEMTTRRNQSNDLKQYARESAAFERELAERRAAANRAIFANVVGSLQSQTSANSTSFNNSTSSRHTATTSRSFNSNLAPWGDLQAEVARAKQMKQDQFNSSQPSRIKQGNVPVTSANKQVTAPAKPSNQSNINVAASSVAKTNSKSKIYEPMPEKVQATTDSWWGSQSQALAYARLRAANQVTSICRGKGARIDSISFPQIEAGVAPSRWNYSAPSCRQGGFDGKEWKCEATVSGTCYRME